MSPQYIEMLRIDNSKELDEELDRAVEDAFLEASMSPGRGVLVTRRDEHTFTIELTHEVPHGIISERDLYTR